MTSITTIGLDIAKKVLQIHGVDAEGKVVVARTPHLFASAFFRPLSRFFATCLATRNKGSCGSLVQHRQPSVGRTVAHPSAAVGLDRARRPAFVAANSSMVRW